jgi:hypothetical protein
MSEKRSDRLRSIIAATVSDAAADAAPVTVTGSSMATTDRHKPSVAQRDAPDTVVVSPGAEAPAPLKSKAIGNATDLAPDLVTAIAAPQQRRPADQAATTEPRAKRGDHRAALRAPQRPARLPKWEKANVTLEPLDLAILQRSDVQARAYGFRIRKGGNPSLFVRAGLRLLDELGDRDPEEWIKRIAATTSLASEQTE